MPVILMCVLIFVVWLRYETTKTSRIDQKNSQIFWSKERKANSSRKKDISNLNYILIPLDKLPIQSTTDEKINQMQDKVIKLANEKILNLTGQTNTDLKLQYGVANLDLLSSFDQNFTLLVRTLNNWAEYLYHLGDANRAKTILEFAIDCGSDISSSYFLLADIYQTEGTPEKISRLISTAENLNTMLKHTILAKLAKQLNSPI